MTPPEQAHVLDRVVWHALTTHQRHLAVGNEAAVRFASEVGPFAALASNTENCWQALADFATPEDRIALVTLDELACPDQFELVNRARIDQMVLTKPPGNPVSGIMQLATADVPEMLELVRLAQPGPFGPRTIETGEYYGIRTNGKLIAMTGERMRLPGFAEISGVCTHPEHRRQGLAEGVMNFVASRMQARGDTPFLHVFSHNAPAIALYERMGYIRRCAFNLLVVRKAA
jgi:ribosomal protein S18 acetylase RimI-like enzyme